MIIKAVITLKPGWSFFRSGDVIFVDDNAGSMVLFNEQEVVDCLNDGDCEPPWTVRFETTRE